MRLRFAVLASLSVLVACAIPGAASAAPRHNHGLTINATPNPILAGEGVFIYGQLNDTPVAGQTIVLYHHLAGRPGYTRVAQATTDSHGFYEFVRAEGVVETNRSWFVRKAGVHRIHSRTIYERVAALVSLSADQTSQYTNRPIVFSGHVTPNHAFERVLLQDQVGATDDWHTLKAGRLDAASNYAIAYRWRIPDVYSVRVLVPGDVRNIRGESDPVAVTIQQAQVPGFTIATSSPIIDYGHSVTISGTLDQPGTTTPESGTLVTLYGRTVGGGFVPLADTTTRSDGSYGFTQMPQQNVIYQVRTTFAPHRHTAVLFEGVRDAVTMMPSSTTSTVGGTVTFMGTVLPDKAGDVVYLQRPGKDGDWHTVAVSLVRSNSTFRFSWRFGTAGTKVFRARIPGDPQSVGGASAPVTIMVSPATSPLALPPGS